MTGSPAPKRRRWRRRILILCVAGLLGLVALPLWFPWVLQPALRAQGIAVAGYERLSYDRIRLRHLRFQDPDVTVEVGQVEMPLLWTWLRDRWARPALPAAPRVMVEDVVVRAHPARKPDGPVTHEPLSMSDLLDGIASALPRVTAWLASAEIRRGRVLWPDDDITVARAVWKDHQLTADLTSSLLPGQAALQVQIKDRTQFILIAQSPDWNGNLQATVTRDQGTWSLQGQAHWQEHPIPFQAQFGPRQWWPARAQVSVARLPAPTPPAVSNLVQGVAVTARVEWVDESFSFHCAVTASNRMASPFLPAAAELVAEGSGDLTSLTLRSLEVDAAPVGLHLLEPMTLVWANLAWPASPWRLIYELPDPMRGQLEGNVTLVPGNEPWPDVEFQLDGDTIHLRELQFRTFTAQGRLAWPLLTLDQAQAQLDSSGPGQLTAHGSLDLNLKRLNQGQVTYIGPIPEAWRHPEVGVEGVDLRVDAQGTWPIMAHLGNLTASNLHGGNLVAERLRLSWEGTNTRLQDWKAELISRTSSVQLSGVLALDPARPQLQGTLSRFDLNRTNTTLLALQQPTAFNWARETLETGRAWHLDSLTLQGPAEESPRRMLRLDATLDWPKAGRFAVAATQLAPFLLEDFLTEAAPTMEVDRIILEGNWQEGPLLLNAQGVGRYHWPDHDPFELSGTLQLDGTSLQIPLVAVAQNGTTLAKVQGVLPLTLDPSQPDEFLRVDESRPLDLQAQSLNVTPLWRLWENRTGLVLSNPAVSLVVTGKLAEALATLNVSARQMALATAPTNAHVAWPAVENLHLRVEADRAGMRLTEGGFRILNQPATLEASYPEPALTLEQWIERLRHLDWTKASAHLHLPQAQLESWAALAPDLLFPMGTLDVTAELKPGGLWSGLLVVTNAAIKPPGAPGPLRGIHALVRVNQNTAMVERMQAEWAGQPVTLHGSVQWSPGQTPLVDLTLRGGNLSLVRRADLFLRASLDLRLANGPGQPPRLSGEVTLQDSLLFRDFRSLIAINLNRPEERPPYFSIDQEPFAHWQLDLRVKGERFLRVLTPVFRGDVSAALALSGTLREPMAVGEVTVPGGRIMFPFGTLNLDRGRITLSRENPYQPQVDMQGSGYNFGYFVRVSVGGSANSPTLTFQSVPPLTPKEILLMLTTGEVPQQTVTFGTTDKVGRLGFYLGREVFNELIGDDQAAERLVIRSGEQVTTDGRLTYSIEYKLNERWSAFGEYSRFRDFNSGLKYRIYSK